MQKDVEELFTRGKGTVVERECSRADGNLVGANGTVVKCVGIWVTLKFTQY